MPPILRDLPEELLGSRVLVRPYRSGDGPAVWAAIEESRGRLEHWMPWVEHHQLPSDSEAFARRMHAQWKLRQDLVVGIWLREGGRFLGSSGLHPVDWEVPSFEMGYWIRTSAEGNGYVTEAGRLLRTFAFEALGANRLALRCDTRNTRSAAVARRLGFTLEGTHRFESRDPSGNLRDMMVFSLLAEDYARLQDEAPTESA